MKNQIRTKSLLILLILGSLLSCRQKPDDSSVVRSGKYKESIKKAYNKVGLFYQSNFIPGLAVAVSIDNQVVWAEGFGYSNYEFKVKASPMHKYRIGQVTELITALTAAKLYEDGKLQLDKPVAEYLPEMKLKSADFTIHQLGAHAAGIRPENTAANNGKTNSLETLIPTFINDYLAFKPGSGFLRSELGFDLIGYLIEKNSKESYTKVVQKTVLDILKLTGTVPDNPFRITENKSSTYEYDIMSQPVVARQIDLRGKEASVGYLSSVLDLVKIGNILIYPGFLKQETIHLLTTPFKLNDGQNSRYGFGLIVEENQKKQTFYGQIGTTKGGCAALLIYPDDKLVIAIAANIGNNSWDLPVFEIADIIMKQLHPEEKEKTTEKTK